MNMQTRMNVLNRKCSTLKLVGLLESGALNMRSHYYIFERIALECGYSYEEIEEYEESGKSDHRHGALIEMLICVAGLDDELEGGEDVSYLILSENNR